MSSITVSDDVIAICTVNAALRTAGVAGFSSGITDTISKNFLGKEPLYKGIKVSQNDDGIHLDLYIIVDYGVNIPSVAWDIQENVKHEVENMTDIEVKAVNIHVQGVRMNEGKEQKNE